MIKCHKNIAKYKDKTKKKKGKLEVREIRTETVLAFDVTDYVAFIVDFDGSDAGADYG